MKKLNKILSTILALLMLLSAFSGLTINASAAAGTEGRDGFLKKYGQELVYNTPEAKLDSMEKMFEKDGFELYVDSITGEVAVKELATGQVLFSNPYDIASSKANLAEVKPHLLSQVAITYMDTSNNNKVSTLYSSYDSAALGQLSVSRIKSGVRVEYTIGEQITRRLVPRLITAERFEEYILGPITEAYNKNEEAIENGELDYNDIDIDLYDAELGIFYTVQTIKGIKNEETIKQMIEKYPLLEFGDLYLVTPDAIDSELEQVEANISKYCPDYTFEMMDEDHEKTGYKDFTTAYPLFKLALEYSLDANGLTVRMPANGLRYDSTTFTLKSIQVLPYMGAAHSGNGGYTFFPDGSGALFDFEELKDAPLTFTQSIYGLDYAYNTLESMGYRTPVRYPVYGVISNEQFYTYSYTDKNGVAVAPITVSSTVKSIAAIEKEVENLKGTNLVIDSSKSYTRGYVAIVESGESLSQLSAYKPMYSNCEYGTVLSYFNPAPFDEFDLSDTASVSVGSKFYLSSSRKYTGSYQVHYKMLTGEKAAAETLAANPTYKAYDTNWLGMAEYYRDYLIANKTLTKLSSSDVKADIPLYIESFGAIETQQMVMTLPVDVMTPLTTFENIGQMYDQLSNDYNVNNINFKLTGFANGGIYSTVPAKLKWESAVGGKRGFKELIEKSQAINNAEDDKNLGVYPDFDFAHINKDTLFDKTNLRKDAVTSIDNRYTTKRVYSASQQKYVTFYQFLVSPSRYDKFYTKLMDKYDNYDIGTISLGSLGNALNSDFDEDDPYNREDSKQQTMDALNAIKNSNDKEYNVMLDSANSYTWAYADHIINLDLQSSNHNKSSATVPFIGAVLHGYVQFAGAPLNEESDIATALLRAIENGASLYFILSYQNTPYLKEDVFLSQYYSVRYDIWYVDVAKYYTALNNMLKDVQTKVIVNHEFINTSIERIMDLDEIQEQIDADLKAAMDAANKAHTEVNLGAVTSVADARAIAAAILGNKGSMATLNSYLADVKAANDVIEAKYAELKAAIDGFEAFRDAELAKVTEEDKSALTTIENKVKEIKALAIEVMEASADLKAQNENATVLATALGEALAAGKAVIEGNDNLSATVKAGYLAEINNASNALAAIVAALASEAVENEAKYDGKTAVSADQYAEKVMGMIEVEGSAYAEDLAKIKTKNAFTAAEILEAGRYEAPAVEDEDDDDTVVDSTISASNINSIEKNSVVAVTYGDKWVDDAGVTHKSEYKTFLLNYNSYAVRLTYNGNLYTIPAGGYVAIYR